MLRLVQPAFPCLCLKSCVCYLGADLKPHIYFSTSPAALFSSSTLLFSASAAFLALSCAVVSVLTYLSTICPADSVFCDCSWEAGFSCCLLGGVGQKKKKKIKRRNIVIGFYIFIKKKGGGHLPPLLVSN